VHISQIIQGSWYTAEFLRFPSEQFERSRQSAWNSKVTAEQSYAISCLFDQAQPKRLSVGTVAQVALPNGTPLNLRTAPDANAPAITQLAGGTQLNIIGGPACFNGDLYSRFWQVQLADGTIGWAPEADTIAYFMQIFIPPTATPTDTATFTPTNTHTPSPTFTPSMTPTPVPGSSWLVFVSNRPTITGGPNLWNIYAADDNHYLVRLTDNTTTAVIKQPVWSPDHLSIAYSRKDGADEDLCILTVSTQSEYCGFAINTLSPNVRNREPAWSPDGQTLAYVTEATNGTSHIYKISLTDLTSGNGRGINLTPGDQNGDSRHPDWRYDGLWIAFSSTRDAEGNAEIYIMPSSGGTPQKMTSTGVNVDNNLPAWSPNGNKIAYNSDYLTDAKHDVVIRNITDSDPSANTTWSFTSLTNLTQNRAGNYRFTAWKKSDTGQNKVAIVRGEDLARQIYLVTLNPLDIDPAPWNTSVAEDDPDW
jgi:Tol biopolymer transport system component